MTTATEIAEVSMTSSTAMVDERRFPTPTNQTNDSLDHLMAKIHGIFSCLSRGDSSGANIVVDFREAIRKAARDVDKLVAKHGISAVMTAIQDQSSRLHQEDEEYTIVALLCLGTLLVHNASLPDATLETSIAHLKTIHEEKHQLNDKYCKSICNVMHYVHNQSSIFTYS